MLLFNRHHREDRLAIASQTPQRRTKCYCWKTTEKNNMLLLDRHHKEEAKIIALTDTTEKKQMFLFGRHHRDEANVIA